MSSTPPAERSGSIRILVINSAAMDSQLMADALSRHPGFQVTASLTTSEQLITSSIDDIQVALISAEAHDPNNRSCALVRKLRLTHPSIRSVIMMNPHDRSAVIEAFRSGAKGVFCRSDSFKSLCKCIRQVHNGQIWANSTDLRYVLEALSETSVPSLLDPEGKNLLSKREADIVNALTQGLSNREIAAQMKLSEHTVKNHLLRI